MAGGSINGVVPSAADISGTSVSLIGTANIVTVSGNQVFISGQPVSVSGNMVTISGQVVRTSGQVSYLVSGQNAVQMSGEVIWAAGGDGTFMQVSPDAEHGDIQSLRTVAHLYARDNTDNWRFGYVTNSGQGISGALHKLIVTQSGDPVTVSGNAVRTSGEVSYPVSGKSYMQAFDPSGVTWNDVWVGQSGGHAVQIAGSFSANVSGNAVRISGETIYPVSGKAFAYAFDPSGNTWNELWVSQSGGHDLRIFGSLSANVSGNVVYLTSGQNAVQISGETVLTSVSGNAVGVSGQVVRIRDQAGSALTSYSYNSDSVTPTTQDKLGVIAFINGYEATTNVGARVRVTASGQGISGIHHKMVVTFSGDSIIGSISGNMVSVSGQVVNVSGGTVSVSGLVGITNGTDTVSVFPDLGGDTTAQTENGLVTVAAIHGYDQVADVWPRIRVTASGQGISGIQHRLPVAFSGDIVQIGEGGTIVDVQPNTSSDAQSTSDNPMTTMALSYGLNETEGSWARLRVTASGQGISGALHKLIVAFSGDAVKPVVPVQIRTRDTLLIDGASGGIALLSGDVLRVTVRNIGVSGTVMYVGGSGDYPWVASGQTYPAFSGRGFWLRDGDGVTIQTSNMAFVRVVSHTSGQYVSYLGEQY